MASNYWAKQRKPDIRDTWQAAVWKPIPPCPGIYIIWFDGTNRAYIGSSNNMASRVRTHLTEMTDWRHKMHRELKTLGSEALRATPLEYVDDLRDLPAVETYWINHYREGGWELYNTDKAGKVHRDRARLNHEY